VLELLDDRSWESAPVELLLTEDKRLGGDKFLVLMMSERRDLFINSSFLD
jgi:hypothetical protein